MSNRRRSNKKKTAKNSKTQPNSFYKIKTRKIKCAVQLAVPLTGLISFFSIEMLPMHTACVCMFVASSFWSRYSLKPNFQMSNWYWIVSLSSIVCFKCNRCNFHEHFFLNVNHFYHSDKFVFFFANFQYYHMITWNILPDFSFILCGSIKLCQLKNFHCNLKKKKEQKKMYH